MWCGTKVSVPYADFDRQRNGLSEAPGVNRSGKWDSGPALVMELAEVNPGMELGRKEIGYGYTVEFDIEVAEEAAHTVLFASRCYGVSG